MNKLKVLPTDGEHRTQEQAIAFHNERKERMLSMPNIFQLVNENNTEVIESLRKDFKDYWLVTSTRIVYNKDNLSAKIIHNADSNVVKQTEINVKEVPVCKPTYIRELIETEEGLNYIRALLDDTKATREQIISFFIKLSGKEVKNIRFWTPDQSSRKSKQIRSVELVFYVFVGFNVYGYDWFDGNGGLSRGVIVNSAKQTKFFSNKAIFDIEEETITMPLKKKLIKEIEKKQSKKEKIKINWDLKVKLK